VGERFKQCDEEGSGAMPTQELPVDFALFVKKCGRI
jgi:hypothetical protein